MAKARITRAMRDTGIRFIRVKTPDQALTVGIHLLRPTQRELEQAVERAVRDLFPAILIHDFGTWGYQRGGKLSTPEDRRASFQLIRGGAG